MAGLSSANLIKQGAEALVFKLDYLSKPTLLKVRPRKGYRHPTLDQRLTRHRCVSEAKLLYRCRGLGVPCPALYFIDETRGEIYMEWIPGHSVRTVLDKLLLNSGEKGMEAATKLMENIGVAVAKLHAVDVVHGDLTTSNIIMKSGDNEEGEGGLEVVLIDFGLGFVSSSEEDKAVDLYVLERAFTSTHPHAEEMFKITLEAYEKEFAGSKPVIKRLKEVRLRGRKRSMIG